MADDNDDIIGPTDLGRKLIVALRSVTDPQALMQSIADRSNAGLRNELSTRLDAMEKATSLWHDDLVRVPTDVQKSTESLKHFLEQYIRAMIATLQSDIGREIERVRGSTEKLEEV